MGYGSHYCLMQQFDSDAAADKTKQKKPTNMNIYLKILMLLEKK